MSKARSSKPARTTAPRGPPKKAKPRPRLGEPLSLTQRWAALEEEIRSFAPRAVGRYARDLEPRQGLQYADFDAAPLLPADYCAFVEKHGYPWVSLPKQSLCFLPPRWAKNQSMAMGERGTRWETVRDERERGVRPYSAYCFASHDVADINGWAFVRDGDQLHVALVEESLPEEVRTPFGRWLSAQIITLERAAARLKAAKRRVPGGDPIDLTSLSLPRAARAAKASPDVLARFKDSATEISLDSRKIGALPSTIARFKKLESLSLQGTDITVLPDEIGELASLTMLDLEWCRQLRELPAAIGKLRALTSLQLNNCWALQSLPPAIGELVSLEALWLKSCEELADLPEEFFQLPKLNSVYLHGTKFPRSTYARIRATWPKADFWSFPI